MEYEYKSENELFSVEEKQGPVVCLGKEFSSDDERRSYFKEELRKKLKDPDFRSIEGFPIGEDEDILALSDPPYYCACPNPWMNELVKEWENDKEKKQDDWIYKREPFASDVSEGKKNPIYNAHSYHTKVPHKAIMRYILHYTEPGDIIFDGFAGTGMTGVAAQFCGNKAEVESLGYRVDNQGNIYRKETNEFGKEIEVKFSMLGVRKAILNDLSPAASFFSYNYNSAVDLNTLSKEFEVVWIATEKECAWMYKTTGPNGEKGRINYTVWSDVFICQECGKEVVFYEEAVNILDGKVKGEFPCPHCKTTLTKKDMDRATVTTYDSVLKKSVIMAKQIPVLINYSIGKARAEKTPDTDDLALFNRINKLEIPYWYPTDILPDGDKTSDPKNMHVEYVHQFYLNRTLYILGSIYNKIHLTSSSIENKNLMKFIFTGIALSVSKLQRFRLFSTFPNMILTGTLYIGSMVREWNLLDWIRGKQKSIFKMKQVEGFILNQHQVGISTESLGRTNIESNSFDYIFLDPPFGANLNYSELSFIWESWLKLYTNIGEEAIQSRKQKKGLSEYRTLMKKCFDEAFRVLKPGRWMTVEFSNTNSAVWNSIQTSLSEVGFIVANVSALDKQQGSFNSVTTSTAVKQDLVLSLYKPDDSFEQQIMQSVGEEKVWTFVRKHLTYLPLVKKQRESTVTVPERDPRIIYDRVIAYFVGKNLLLPISSPDFLGSIGQRFVERDGLYYLPDQVIEYDRMKAKQQLKTFADTVDWFVYDEASAINWIRNQLKQKPFTLGELTPLFLNELKSWNKTELRLELSVLLEQSFLCYEGQGEVPSFIHGYLSTNFKDMRNLPKNDASLVAKAKGRWYVPDPNREKDLEKMREKALLKEFDLYKNAKGKLKEFRIEAIRAGFKRAWQERDYQLIKGLSERLPKSVVEEDEKLLLWYNGAMTRLGL